MLLFMTNFVSIVLAASVVFVLVGVVPIASLVESAERTQGWFVVVRRGRDPADDPARDRRPAGGRRGRRPAAATAAVEAWLAPAPGSRSSTCR